MSLQQTVNLCVIVEFSHTTIYTQMMASYTAAFTPGTQANQSRQAKIYLMFMRVYNFDPYNPSVISLLLYLQVLANSFENITTIKNYLSGAKTHVTKLGGDVSNFSNPQLGTMIKGITKLSTHVPRQAPPFDSFRHQKNVWRPVNIGAGRHDCSDSCFSGGGGGVQCSGSRICSLGRAAQQLTRCSGAMLKTGVIVSGWIYTPQRQSTTPHGGWHCRYRQQDLISALCGHGEHMCGAYLCTQVTPLLWLTPSRHFVLGGWWHSWGLHSILSGTLLLERWRSTLCGGPELRRVLGPGSRKVTSCYMAPGPHLPYHHMYRRNSTPLFPRPLRPPFHIRGFLSGARAGAGRVEPPKIQPVVHQCPLSMCPGPRAVARMRVFGIQQCWISAGPACHPAWEFLQMTFLIGCFPSKWRIILWGFPM